MGEVVFGEFGFCEPELGEFVFGDVELGEFEFGEFGLVEFLFGEFGFGELGLFGEFEFGELLFGEFVVPGVPGLELEPLGEEGEFCWFVPVEFPGDDCEPEPCED